MQTAPSGETIMRLPGHLERQDSDLDGPRFCLAFDRLRHVPVAAKWATGRSELSALANEWQVLHRLRPGPFLRPIEFERVDDHSGWMTTERLDALPFSDWREATTMELLAVAIDALGGLSLLHRAGYVHGDVRPQNLLVRRAKGEANRHRAFWADLEHALPFDQLAAGFSYISGWHAEQLERGDPQTPRADLAALGGLLRERLLRRGEVGDPAGRCVMQLGSELMSENPVSMLLSAEEAHFRAVQICAESEVELPAAEPHVGPPVFIANRAAERWWRTSWPRWQECERPLLVRVDGGSGTGKSSFLRAAAATAALEGHRVVDLLGIADRESSQTPAMPDWSCGSEFGSPRTGTVLVLLPSLLWPEFLDGAALWARPGTIVVVECRSGEREKIPVPSKWQVDECSFPPLSAREWFRWVNESF